MTYRLEKDDLRARKWWYDDRSHLHCRDSWFTGLLRFPLLQALGLLLLPFGLFFSLWKSWDVNTQSKAFLPRKCRVWGLIFGFQCYGLLQTLRPNIMLHSLYWVWALWLSEESNISGIKENWAEQSHTNSLHNWRKWHPE